MGGKRAKKLALGQLIKFKKEWDMFFTLFFMSSLQIKFLSFMEFIYEILKFHTNFTKKTFLWEISKEDFESMKLKYETRSQKGKTAKG